MEKPILDTEIDDLLRVLSEKESVSLEEASKLMGVDEKTMHTWVDSLVEERVIILDYNFLTPVIKLSPERKKEFQEKKKDFENRQKESIAKKLGLKGSFYEKAGQRRIDERKIPLLWKRFVAVNETSLKKEFMEKAEKRMIEGDLEKLWGSFIRQF